MTALRMVHEVITRAEMRRIKTEFSRHPFPQANAHFLGQETARQRLRSPECAIHHPLDACPALMFFSGFP